MTEEERAWILTELKQQERQVYDAEGIRWVKCKYCGQVLPANECLSFGGIGSVNLGECRSCGPRTPEKKICSKDEYTRLLRMRKEALDMIRQIEENRELWKIYSNVHFPKLVRELDERLNELRSSDFYTPDATEIDSIEESKKCLQNKLD